MPFAPSGYRGARAGTGPLGQCGRTHGGREFNQICFGDIVFIQYRVEGRLFQRLAVDGEFGPIQCLPDGTFEAPERLHLNFPDLERVQYAHVNGVGSLVGEVSAYADSKLLMSLSYVNRLKAIVEEQINPALTVTDLSTVFAFDVENAAYSNASMRRSGRLRPPLKACRRCDIENPWLRREEFDVCFTALVRYRPSGESPAVEAASQPAKATPEVVPLTAQSKDRRCAGDVASHEGVARARPARRATRPGTRAG